MSFLRNVKKSNEWSSDNLSRFSSDAVICCSVKWEQWSWLLSSGQRYYEGLHHAALWRATWWRLCQEPEHSGLSPSSAIFVVCHHQCVNSFWSSQLPHLWNGKVGFLKMGCIFSIENCLPITSALGLCFSKAGPTIGSEKEELLENIAEWMNAHTQGPQVWLYYTQLQGKRVTAHEDYDRNRVPVVGQHGGLLPVDKILVTWSCQEGETCRKYNTPYAPLIIFLF